MAGLLSRDGADTTTLFPPNSKSVFHLVCERGDFDVAMVIIEHMTLDTINLEETEQVGIERCVLWSSPAVESPIVVSDLALQKMFLCKFCSGI